jgi:hypothetical protein
MIAHLKLLEYTVLLKTHVTSAVDQALSTTVTSRTTNTILTITFTYRQAVKIQVGLSPS